VARVPSCSPEAVAEHAVALMLTLNRKTHKAYLRVREANPALAAVTARPRLAPQPRAVALS